METGGLFHFLYKLPYCKTKRDFSFEGIVPLCGNNSRDTEKKASCFARWKLCERKMNHG